MSRPPRQLLTAAIVTAVCAVVLSACGASGKHEPRHKSDSDAFLAFSECMRSHGVTNFPDPSSGGGINLGGAGVDPSSPVFKTAQSGCQKLLPGGGPPTGPPSKQEVDQTVAMAKCMRAHGVSGFPDPYISSKPPTDLSGQNDSIVEDRDGLILAVPNTIDVSSPGFQRAAKVCHFS